MVISYIQTDSDDILYVANKYHIDVSYPQYDRNLPSREEIKEVLDFSEKLFDDISEKLDIDIEDIE